MYNLGRFIFAQKQSIVPLVLLPCQILLDIISQKGKYDQHKKRINNEEEKYGPSLNRTDNKF